jgi:hypothetical protein
MALDQQTYRFKSNNTVSAPISWFWSLHDHDMRQGRQSDCISNVYTYLLEVNCSWASSNCRWWQNDFGFLLFAHGLQRGIGGQTIDKLSETKNRIWEIILNFTILLINYLTELFQSLDCCHRSSLSLHQMVEIGEVVVTLAVSFLVCYWLVCLQAVLFLVFHWFPCFRAVLFHVFHWFPCIQAVLYHCPYQKLRYLQNIENKVIRHC